MSDIETLVRELKTPQWRAPHNSPCVSALDERAAAAIAKLAKQNAKLVAALAAETARADRAEQERDTWIDVTRTQWERHNLLRAECDRLRAQLHASGTGYAETRDR